jgi:hypothetical protein
MARYVAASTSGGTPSATRPFLSVYSIAAVGFGLVESAIFNTTTTAHRAQLARLTSTGTQGAGLTEAKYDDDSATNSCTAFATHTADPGIGDKMHMAPCGAVVGAGTILTFYDRPIEVPVGTASGIGLIVVTGTPQVSDIHYVWDE